MRKSSNTFALRLALVGGLSLIPFEQAYAQVAPAAPPAATADEGLAPIVVTAERRTENSQRVPIAIQHIDGDTIAKYGYTSITDLQYMTPGLQYDPTQGAAFQIRGVGSESFDFSNAKSVSVVVDDVVMDEQRQNGLTGLVDIAGVDVLMGPQGTLFGMNSTSGVISVTTGKPKVGETSLRATASYGEHNDRILNATINVPIAQDVALRVSGFNNAQDGFGRNVTLNKTVGSVDEYGGRAKLLWQPSDRVDVTLSGDYQHHWDSSVRTPVSGQPAAVTADLNALGVHPGPESADTADSTQGYIISDEWGGSLRIHAKIGENDLTSITAYRGSVYDNSTPADLLPANVYSYIPFNYGHLTTSKISEEVHLASATGHFFEWLVGGIYNRLDSSQTQLQWATLGAPLIGPTGTPITHFYALTGAIGQSGNTSLFHTINESAAAFGQAKFNVSDRFTLAIGGRYTHDRNSQSLNFVNTDPVSVVGYTPTFTATSAAPVYNYGVVKGYNFSIRVSPEYRLNRNVMAYFTFSTGYKPAGIAFVGNAYDPYLAEKVKSYEAGIKSEWFNHKLRVNLDAFLENFSEFQTTILTNIPNGIGGFLQASAIGNAGGLRSQGFEGSVAVKPTHSLSLSASATYTDAHFTDYVYNKTTDYTGTRLTNAPRFSATAAVDYEHDVTQDISGRAHLDYAYRSTVWTVVGQPAYSEIPAFSLVNARLSLLTHHDTIEFGVYTRNLFNQYFSTGWQLYGALGYLHYTSPDARRTVGGFVNVKF